MDNDKLTKRSGLTANFSKKEFTCKCGCGTFNLDMRIPQMLEILRKQVNEYLKTEAQRHKDTEAPVCVASATGRQSEKPIIVMSACRCERHNAKVGGAKNSYHLVGKAVDITVSGLKMSELMYIVEAHCNASFTQQAKLPIWTGRGIYLAKNIIHLDIGERDKIINPQSTIRQKSPIENRQSKIVRWIDISKRGYKYVNNFNELYKVDKIMYGQVQNLPIRYKDTKGMKKRCRQI